MREDLLEHGDAKLGLPVLCCARHTHPGSGQVPARLDQRVRGGAPGPRHCGAHRVGRVQRFAAAPRVAPHTVAEYDYAKIYASMMKPAFLFDGRLLLDHAKLKALGFDVCRRH